MIEQTHIIKKQVIELELNSGLNTFNALDRFRTFYYDIILDILNEIFSELTHPDEFLRFDKLEIHLGLFSPEMTMADFRRIVRKRLYDIILENINEDRFFSVQKFISEEGKIISSSPRYGEKFEKIAGTVSGNERDLELIICFINTGTIPWWALPNETELNKIIAGLIKTNPNEIRAFLIRAIKSERALERVLNQFSAKVLEMIIGLLYENNATEIIQWKSGLLVEIQSGTKQLSI